jgi:hypothetical protein
MVRYRLVAFACLCHLLSVAVHAEEAVKLPALTVVPGEWDAPADNIEAVCRSAAIEIAKHAPDRKWDPIAIRQDLKQGPMVVYGKDGEGRRRVLLNVKGTYWSQFSYQFAHELCHILCNYREGDKSNHWFEESLCELASLYTMRQMAETWKTKPPYSNWKDYAPSLGKYAQDRIDATEKLGDLPLAQWYRRHEPELRKNPTERARNQVVAVALLPLFEKDPAGWAALGSLNQGDAKRELTFAEYLRGWHSRVPAERKAFVAEIAKQFEIDVSNP